MTAAQKANKSAAPECSTIICNWSVGFVSAATVAATPFTMDATAGKIFGRFGQGAANLPATTGATGYSFTTAATNIHNTMISLFPVLLADTGLTGSNTIVMTAQSVAW